MALVTSIREIPQRLDRTRYPEVDLTGLTMSSSSSEIVEERRSSTSSSSTPSSIFTPPSPALRNSEEAVYVAVGKEVKEAEFTLSWALRNCERRKTIILHVHQPAQKISTMGANVPICLLEEHQHHEVERQDMQKLLDKYMLICKEAGVQADKLYIEMDSIEKGILELISLHGIKKLVMGGAAKGHYSKSKKAIYVCQQAPAFCQIWFICKGHLIHTRYDLKFQFQEGTMHDKLYDRLQQSMEETEISGREAYEESMRHRKAEKKAVEAARRAKESETMNSDEFRHRKEVEEALARHQEQVEKMKYQLDEIKETLRISLQQKSSLECQIATSDKTIQELEQRMFSAVELLQKYKMERDNLQVERDNAVREAEIRKKQAEEASSASISCFFSEYSFLDIKEATHNFDAALKIGEGGYGSIYKGLLRNTQVAIKILHPHSLQGPLEFRLEVNILSKLRHPNLVTLIGACPEAWALIYEYLPNGSLEDRLSCKDNTPPLSWQTRIRIASELCFILIFLHSCFPRGIVHGDLKPANILLDINFVSKLSGFGICGVLREDEFSDNKTTLCCGTDPKGTFAYIDPDFLATRELTPKSDVYSFGIILLRLLTGKPALGIFKEVQSAFDKGNLKDILDSTAGDWPFVQAQQLAHLALSCCDMSRKNRPELASEIWRVLEPMRTSCGASSSRLISKEQSQSPSYFSCPIFQEVMQDPVVAADGFTYEAEALKGWLDSGHDTSPMTNLKLTHCNFVPNHALRSAIQEWLQQP